MFRGVNEINVDAKGRIAVPARYRQDIVSQSAGHLISTIDPEEKCLLIYPLPEWEIIEQKIESLPSFHPFARRLQRLLIGYATELDMDIQGRVLLSSVLRDYADLNKQVTLVGQGKKFELWSHTHWLERRDTWLSEANSNDNDLPQDLKTLSL